MQFENSFQIWIYLGNSVKVSVSTFYGVGMAAFNQIWMKIISELVDEYLEQPRLDCS